MLGWMLIFALMLLCGATAAVESVRPAPGMTSSLVFGFLLGVSARTRLLRGRA
jgi:ABC-type Mn2+/Zn2+ transport system permease subunit